MVAFVPNSGWPLVSFNEVVFYKAFWAAQELVLGTDFLRAERHRGYRIFRVESQRA